MSGGPHIYSTHKYTHNQFLIGEDVVRRSRGERIGWENDPFIRGGNRTYALATVVVDVPQCTTLLVNCILVEYLNRPFAQRLNDHPGWGEGLQINRQPLPSVVQGCLEYNHTLRLSEFDKEVRQSSVVAFQHNRPISSPGTNNEHIRVGPQTIGSTGPVSEDGKRLGSGSTFVSSVFDSLVDSIEVGLFTV